MKRLLSAAESGDVEAQFNLGVLYDNPMDDNGHAITGNRAEAIRWLLRAAEQGLARAQYKLAELYAMPPTRAADQIKSCAWFLVAARNSTGVHRHKAQMGFQEIAAQMSPIQIEKATRRARGWKPTKQHDTNVTATTGEDAPRSSAATL